MVVLLGRVKGNKPTIKIEGFGSDKVITEEDLKVVSELIEKKKLTDEDENRIIKIYLSGKSILPTYSLGESIVWINKRNYLVGQVIKINPDIEDEYFITFGDGLELWVNAESLHKIANVKNLTVVVE